MHLQVLDGVIETYSRNRMLEFTSAVRALSYCLDFCEKPGGTS